MIVSGVKRLHVSESLKILAQAAPLLAEDTGIHQLQIRGNLRPEIDAGFRAAHERKQGRIRRQPALGSQE
jgi:hypothetical protein